MNEKQKAAFLKREKWYPAYCHKGCWADPKDGMAMEFQAAYKFASRRKAARDARRLKKAGFEIRVLGDGRGNTYRDWYLQGTDTDATPFEPGFAGTKSEALVTLKKKEAA